MTISDRILPRTVDNTYTGSRIALVFFGLITAVTLWRSQHHIFAPDGGAQSIATIPLDTYSDGAAMTVIGIFANWGLSQLLMGLVFVLILLRYRSLLPLGILFFTAEYAGRLGISMFKSVETVSTAPGAAVNAPAVAVGLIMLALSLWQRKS